MAIVEDTQSSVDLTGTLETYYRSSGAGGQHRNKTDSACRLQHPSGVVVTSAQERSQWQNRAIAWAELERRLREQADSNARVQKNDDRVSQLETRGLTFTEWRDEVVNPTSGRRARYSDIMKGKNWTKLI